MVLRYLPGEWQEQEGLSLGYKWAHYPKGYLWQNSQTGWWRPGGSGRRKSEAKPVFTGNGVGLEQPTTVGWQPVSSPPKTTLRLGPARSVKSMSCVDEQRRRKTEVRMRLQTIHPNPGPRKRSDADKDRRRQKRKERRKANSERKKERKRQEELGKVKEELKVVTWNVQGMSLRGLWKRKAKLVAQIAKEQEWDAVLLTEIKANGVGVVWCGWARMRSWPP